MSHFVPDFEMENEDDSLPTASADTVPHPLWKSSLPEDEIIELLWHDGQLVMQSQNQRSAKKPAPGLAATTQSHRYSATDAQLPTDSCAAREIRSSQSQIQMEQQQRQHMFMQEDEMISWLHYPMVDEPPLETNFCADLLYSSTAIANNTSNSSDVPATASPVVTATTGHPVRLSRNTELSQPSTTTVAAEVSARRPPIPPSRSTIPNFAHFSRHNVKARAEPSVHLRQPSISRTAVDSNETPAMARPSGISEIRKNSADVDPTRVAESSAVNAPATITSSTGWTDVTPCEVKLTSSPGASSASAEPIRKAPTEDRKRKGREPEDCEEYSEDVDFESLDAKKQPRGSTSTKKSRASEVHNLSERRRRDRINEKMKALQELIPRCNKSDKASMLDEAIEYLKSLQLQVQMMSMGCGMVPMMLPGFPQYMPTMEMGIGMGMGMEMEMGMNRAVMPFANVLAGPAFPAPAATAHYGPRFFTPPFPMPLVPPPGSSRTQATTQADHILTSLASPDPNQSRSTTLSDPYQQYLGPYQMQLQSTQNQAMNQPSLSKPTTSKPNENGEIRQPG